MTLDTNLFSSSPSLFEQVAPESLDKQQRRAVMWVRRYLLGLVGLTVGLMALGSATRVMNAGLSCPDWPLCYGQLVPQAQMDQQVFLEWFHRLVASLVGSGTLGLVALAWARRWALPRWFPWVTLLAGGLVIWQGILGALTVTELLRFDIVTAHLGTALLFFSVLVALTASLWPQVGTALAPDPLTGAPTKFEADAEGQAITELTATEPTEIESAPVIPDLGALLAGTAPTAAVVPVSPEALPWRPAAWLLGWAGGAALLVYGQSLLGALVASQWAVNLCLGEAELCQVMNAHLLGVVPATLATLAVVGRGLWQRRLPTPFRWLVGGAALLLLTQLGLGLSTFLLQLRVEWLTVAHQSVGALLLGTLVALASLSWRRQVLLREMGPLS